MRSTKFPANCRPSRSVYKQTHTHTHTHRHIHRHSQWHTRATPKSRKANSNIELGWGWGWWLQLSGRAEQSKSVKSAKAQVDATSRQPAVPPRHFTLPLCLLFHSLCYLHFVLPAFLLPSPSRAPACSPARAERQRQPFGYLPLLGSCSATLLLGSATRALCTSRQLATARTLTRTCLLARLSFEHAPHTRPRPDLI